MKKTDIVRAWKDATYRAGLSAAERAELPANPAGELTDADLVQVSGGATEQRTWGMRTFSCAPGLTITFYPAYCPHN